MRRAARSISLAAIVCGLIACPPPPPPPALPPAPPPTPPRAPSEMPAAWYRTGGATAVGPQVSGGTLVLLSGRRALVAPDGSVKEETSETPEPLLQVILVPSASGDRIIGRSASAVYRFDDPLGPPVVLATFVQHVDRIDAGPGLVAVPALDGVHFVDVDTGAAVPEAFPGILVDSLAFRSMKDGAAILLPSGLAVTRDGGATWRSVHHAKSQAQPFRLNENPFGLEASGDLVRETTWGHTIDIETATMLETGPAVRAGERPLLVQWVACTGVEPRLAALDTGILLGGREALFSIDRLRPNDGRSQFSGPDCEAVLAPMRVDLVTGRVSPRTLDPAEAYRGCRFTVGGDDVWISCPNGNVYRQIAGHDFVAARPELTVASQGMTADIKASASGGVALDSPCRDVHANGPCVRQPDGSWRDVPFTQPNESVFPSWWAPLADGGVAYLPDSVVSRDPRVVFVAPSGARRETRPYGETFTPARGSPLLVGVLDEEPDRSLHFMAVDKTFGDRHERVFVVALREDAAAADVTLVPGVSMGMLGGARGFAMKRGAPPWTSSDFGATWSEGSAPSMPSNPWWGGPVPSEWDARDSAGVYKVSAVGAAIEDHYRVGWGPSVAPPPPTPAPLGPKGARGEAPLPTLHLTCKHDGPAVPIPPTKPAPKQTAPPPAEPLSERGGALFARGKDGKPYPFAALLLRSRGSHAYVAPGASGSATVLVVDPLARRALMRDLPVTPPDGIPGLVPVEGWTAIDVAEGPARLPLCARGDTRSEMGVDLPAVTTATLDDEPLEGAWPNKYVVRASAKGMCLGRVELGFRVRGAPREISVRLDAATGKGDAVIVEGVGKKRVPVRCGISAETALVGAAR